MAEKEWVITVKDDHLHRLDEVVAELEAAGLRVDRVLSLLGQVTGRTSMDEEAPDAGRASLCSALGWHRSTLRCSTASTRQILRCNSSSGLAGAAEADGRGAGQQTQDGDPQGPEIPGQVAHGAGR